MGNLPRVVRILLYVLAAALVVFVLFEWVFPWVEVRMEDPTLGAVVRLTLPAR